MCWECGHEREHHQTRRWNGDDFVTVDVDCAGRALLQCDCEAWIPEPEEAPA